MLRCGTVRPSHSRLATWCAFRTATNIYWAAVCREQLAHGGFARSGAKVDIVLPEMLERNLEVLRLGGGGARSRFICGFLACDRIWRRPFCRDCPVLIRVSIKVTRRAFGSRTRSSSPLAQGELERVLEPNGNLVPSRARRYSLRAKCKPEATERERRTSTPGSPCFENARTRSCLGAREAALACSSPCRSLPMRQAVTVRASSARRCPPRAGGKMMT